MIWSGLPGDRERSVTQTDRNITQNVPRPDSDAFKLRGAFQASKPENILGVGDYSALEMRIIADIADEPDMIAIFQKGWDIHMGNASMVFGVPYEDIVKAKKVEKDVKAGKLPKEEMTDYYRQCMSYRQDVKAVGFGLNYGMQKQTLAKRLNRTEDEAQALMDRYLGTYKQINNYFTEMAEIANETGYGYTYLGRRRYFPDIWSNNRSMRSKAERAASNIAIQGGAADVVKMAMLLCDSLDLERRFGVKMLLQVHDELVFEGPEETMPQAMKEIVECCEHPFHRDLRVPLVFEAGMGKSWDTAK